MVRELSWKARIYISLILILGASIYGWSLLRLDAQDVALVVALTALASAAQVFKVEGQTGKSSYNLSWTIFAFTFVLLGAATALFVILVAHLVEWVWHRYPWFIQMFNIANYGLSIAAAFVVHQMVLGLAPDALAWQALAILAAFLAFTFINHLLVGLVLMMARGESLAESGVFGFFTLTIDFTLLCLGAAAAIVWGLNPFAVVLAIIPLYLIYSTLKVPALKQKTRLDEKTGLFNARYFAEALEKELARAERFNRPLTVVLGDMDMLRNINNTYGHLAGDEVLKGVAGILNASTREYDIVARFGGEEFAILMPECTPEAAYPHIEAIRFAIESAEFEVETSVTPIQCTLSFGIAGREDINRTANELIHDADVALYSAKLKGRNMTTIYSDGGVEDLFKVATEAGKPGLGASLQDRLMGDLPSFKPSLARQGPAKPQQPEDQVVKPATGQLNSNPTRRINIFVAALAVVAFSLAWHLFSFSPPIDRMALITFVLLTILAEALSIEIYVKDSSVSTAVAPFIAGSLILGPLGIIPLSLSLAGVAWLKHRSPPQRFVFNTSNHLLGGLLAFGFVALTGIPISDHVTWAQVGLTVLAAGIVYLSTTSMVSGAISLDMGLPIVKVWKEQFRWLSPYYLALGAVSFVMLFGYFEVGMLGVLIAVVPLLMLRFVQSQYLNRTRNAVSELREMNVELKAKAEEIGLLSEELLITLSKAIDLRDPFVYGHSEHVTRYATLIAREMGLPAGEIELIRKAGLLHDIGKIAVPEEILLRPGQLTSDEYEIVKQHPVLGADLLANCHSLHEIISLVRHHHERYDGHGYPDQVSGEQLILGARILALADSVDAMASDRPYRQALNAVEILSEIRENSGSQFDPKVAEAFIRILNREGTAIILNSARKVAAEQYDPSSLNMRQAELVPALNPHSPPTNGKRS